MTDIGLPRDEDTERRRSALHLLLMASRYHPAGSWPALINAALLMRVKHSGQHVSALVGGISSADLDALYSMRICDLFDTPPPGASVQARLHADARRYQADLPLLDEEEFVARTLGRLGLSTGDSGYPTTELGTWAALVPHEGTSVEDMISTALGEHAGGYDAGGLAVAFRAAVNAALPDQITLAGDIFYGPALAEDRAWDGAPALPDIDVLVEGIDFWEIAAQFEHDETTGSTP